jgi:antitoxin MazE
MRSVTISGKGQIAIPKEVREDMKINAGDRFEVEVSDGNILLKPVVTITVPKNQAWFWTEEVQKQIREAEEEYKKGKYKTYNDTAELVSELKKR